MKNQIIATAALTIFGIAVANSQGQQPVPQPLSEHPDREIKGQRSIARTERVVLRGSVSSPTSVVIAVYVPTQATVKSIKAYMKNEPWGGIQNPVKPDTDDMKTTWFIECRPTAPDCPVGWSKVGRVTPTSLVNGMTEYRATFTNWVGRNDRTGALEVEFVM